MLLLVLALNDCFLFLNVICMVYPLDHSFIETLQSELEDAIFSPNESYFIRHFDNSRIDSIKNELFSSIKNEVW